MRDDLDMEITCGSCGSEELTKDTDAPRSDEIALLCLDCGWRGTRTPRASCPRCASTEISENGVDGWAYADLDDARESPGTAEWGYVDKADFRCLKCRHEWRTAGTYRPYEASSQGDVTNLDPIWRTICSLAGQDFTTKTGKPFAYDASASALVLRNTNRSLPKGDFAEALRRMPVSGPGELQDLQGPSYLYAILTDQRVQVD